MSVKFGTLLVAGDGQRTQAAILDQRRDARKIIDRDIELAAQHIGDHLGAALVRHVGDRHAAHGAQPRADQLVAQANNCPPTSAGSPSSCRRPDR